jgi:spore coat protein U-like protein
MKRKLMSILVVVVCLLVAANLSLAANKTQALGVSANVAASCSISAVDAIAFGAYDPTAGSAVDATGGMTFRCVKNTSYKTFITGTRSMTGGGDTLNFGLYSDSDRSATYGSDNTVSATNSSNNAPVNTSIYGRIPADQNVGVSAYTASLTATIEY